MLRLKIDPAVVDPADVGLLEDLVLSAVQQALAKGREAAAAEMGKVTGGLGLPGGPWTLTLRRTSIRTDAARLLHESFRPSPRRPLPAGSAS